MNDLLYYCTRDNNTCSKKETCERYLEADNKNSATLFKLSCTENNNYILYIKQEKDKKES